MTAPDTPHDKDGVREMLAFLSRGSAGESSAPGEAEEGVLWSPRADVYEIDETLYVVLEIAGMKSKEFHIRVEGSVLVVRGERRPPHDRRRRRYHVLEWRTGPFEKRIPLPGGYDLGRPRSRYVDGVLEISFPGRREERKR